MRQILFKDHDVKLDAEPVELEGKTVGEAILEPTKIYVKAVLPLIRQGLVDGVSHITGGGLIENLPRMYSDDLQAEIMLGSWKVLPVFRYLQKMGELAEDDMRETFNLGLGMVLAVKPENVDALVGLLEDENESWYKVGQLKNVQTVKKNYFQVRGRIMKIAILASGNGTNFQALAEKFQSGEIPGELSLLFAIILMLMWLNVPKSSTFRMNLLR